MDRDISFWDFTLAAYRKEGVSASAISLQNGHGADVNLLFYCCWCAATGRGALDEHALRRADLAVESWRKHVTRPLRAVRDAIKKDTALAALPEAMEMRKKVLAAEIDSERVAQMAMQAGAPPAGTRPGEALADAARSLTTYASMLGESVDGPVRAALAELLVATQTGSDARVAEAALDTSRSR